MWKISYFKFLIAISLSNISFSQADVPNVFKDGETILAEEINENFRQQDSKVGRGPSEAYNYSQKNLGVGLDKLTVLKKPYDIVQMKTLSFDDHGLFTLKFPSAKVYRGVGEKSLALDIVELGLPNTTERRFDGWVFFENTISGYPASINVNVKQGHEKQSLNPAKPTEAEFDSIEWEKHEFYFTADAGGVFNKLRLYITGPNPNPYYDGDYHKTLTIRCDSLDQVRGDFPQTFSWNAKTNASYSYYSYGDESKKIATPSVQGNLSTAISSCLANEKINRQFQWRRQIYNTYFDISLYATILLDEATTTMFSYSFNEAEYATDLRRQCSPYNVDKEAEWNCGADTEAFSRNFSTLIDQQSTLARKPRREEYIQELFKLLDHIVITKDVTED